jgi:hypothetical protein
MHRPTNQPSEKYLLIHRLFTFFDEWLFYGVLLLLYFSGIMKEDPAVFWIVTTLGASFILISYAKQWYMEAMRFESKKRDS